MTHDPHRDTHTERSTVVTTNGGGPGMIIGVILAILAVVLVLWLIFGLDDADPEGAGDVDVTVDVDDTTGEADDDGATETTAPPEDTTVTTGG